MTVYLVRHAIAEASARSDAVRSLTEEGRAKMERAVAGLRRFGAAPRKILTSPLVRARQTAEILARGLDGVDIEVCDELAPGGAPETQLSLIAEHRTESEIAVVGHEPSMGQLTSYLLTGSASGMEIQFRKGAVASLEVSFGGRPRSTLLWMLPPRALRMLGKGSS